MSARVFTFMLIESTCVYICECMRMWIAKYSVCACMYSYVNKGHLCLCVHACVWYLEWWLQCDREVPLSNDFASNSLQRIPNVTQICGRRAEARGSRIKRTRTPPRWNGVQRQQWQGLLLLTTLDSVWDWGIGETACVYVFDQHRVPGRGEVHCAARGELHAAVDYNLMIVDVHGTVEETSECQVLYNVCNIVGETEGSWSIFRFQSIPVARVPVQVYMLYIYIYIYIVIYLISVDVRQIS